MKIFIKSIAIVALLSFTYSCEQETFCECTTTYSGNGSGNQNSSTEVIGQLDNGSDCTLMNTESTNSDGLTTTYSCVQQ